MDCRDMTCIRYDLGTLLDTRSTAGRKQAPPYRYCYETLIGSAWQRPLREGRYCFIDACCLGAGRDSGVAVYPASRQVSWHPPRMLTMRFRL